MPESIQGIIAARLDLLATEEKSLLQDAAVLGKVFWSGALIAVDDRDRSRVEQVLHVLERKEFVHPSRRSSVEDEREYTFRHLLVRDVVYGQIPRAARAAKHRRAAEWIESLGRPEDHAEMVAHHYLSSLELAQAAGESAEGLSERAVVALQEAGDRAFALNAYGAAARFYEGALALWPDESLDRSRAQLTFRLGRAIYAGETTGEETLAQASAALSEAGDAETAAEAELLLYDLYWHRGMRDVALEHLDRARTLVADLAPSRAKAYLTAARSRFHALNGDEPEAVRLGREALAMAELLSLDELRANALNTIGMSRGHLGGGHGIDELETSIAIAREANASTELCRGLNNLASMILQRGDLARAWELAQEFRAAAAQYGQTSYLRWSRQLTLEYDYWAGRWSQAEWTANECIAELEAGSPHYHGGQYHYFRALIRVARDDIVGALDDAERGLELARLAKDPQILFPSLSVCSYVRMVAGKPVQGAALADELLDAVRGQAMGWECVMFPTFAWAAVGLSRGPALVSALPSGTPWKWVDAARALGASDFAAAADICAGMGARPEEAWARLHAAERFVHEDRRHEGDEQLQQALAFYRSVGASRYVREGEALLATAS
jgi:tetratricopeptide (TPR) repeat protein